jgi:hypothetical protein
VVDGTVSVPLSVTEDGGVVSATVALTDAGVPPLLLQASAYVVSAEIGPTCSVPDVARGPVHPPEAVQLVAFVADHVSVAMPPCKTEVGFEENVTVGVTGGGLAPPPPPPPPPQLAARMAQAMTGSRATVRVMIDLILLKSPQVGERSSEHSRINTHKRRTPGKNDTLIENKAIDATLCRSGTALAVAGG